MKVSRKLCQIITHLTSAFCNNMHSIRLSLIYGCGGKHCLIITHSWYIFFQSKSVNIWFPILNQRNTRAGLMGLWCFCIQILTATGGLFWKRQKLVEYQNMESSVLQKYNILTFHHFSIYLLLLGHTWRFVWFGGVT